MKITKQGNENTMKITEKKLRQLIREAAGRALLKEAWAPQGLKEEIRNRLEGKMGPGGQSFAREVAAAFEGAAYEYLGRGERQPEGPNQADRDKIEAAVQWVVEQVMADFDVFEIELNITCAEALEKLEE